MKVIENLIPVSLQDDVEKALNDESFEWFFTDSITAPNDVVTLKDIPKWDESKVTAPLGLTHVPIYHGQDRKSSIYPLCRSILYFLEQRENIVIDKVMRIRIRRTMPTPGHDENMHNVPHVDVQGSMPFYTLIYYPEETDGDTILFDHVYKKGSNAAQNVTLKITDKIPPKRGNAILFDGLRFHAGNCPIKYKKRTIINFDFTVKNI